MIGFPIDERLSEEELRVKQHKRVNAVPLAEVPCLMSVGDGGTAGENYEVLQGR